MMPDPNLLTLLVCPQCRTALQVIDEQLIAQMNERIKTGALQNVAGKSIKPIQGGYRCPQHGHVFPLRGGVPLMLVDEAISLVGFSTE